MDKSVLVVEDDFFISDLYKIALTNSGYVVDTAFDGEEALQKANAQTYKIILLDIMLPKKTGIDVLRDIRSHVECKSHKSTVVVTSNMAQESVIQTAMELGAAKYLVKAHVDVKDIITEVDLLYQETVINV